MDEHGVVPESAASARRAARMASARLRREVMRYAGPRTMLRHPGLAIGHMLDKRRPAPPKPRGAAKREPR